MPELAAAEAPPASKATLRDERRDRAWAALAAGVAVVAMRGAFTLSSVYHVRDLAYQYWPLHVWFSETVARGDSLLWDPYPAFGQSAIADPVRHLFFPPVVLLRLLLPQLVAFNLTVALPFPVAAVGMFAYLRRHVSGPAASLGAIAFAVSGPFLGSGDFLNMAWAVALVPYVLLAADRLAERPSGSSFALVAVCFALQFLAAEPVTLVTTGALVTAYVAVAAQGPSGLAARARRVAAFVAAGATGFLLAGVQSLPFVESYLASARSTGIRSGYHTIGSVHPLSLVETVMPALFGDPVLRYFTTPPWLSALNVGFEPIVYSVYVGLPALALASIGLWASPDRAWALFWLVVLVFATLLALGVYTPVFPALAELPLARSFRFPSKFSIQAAFAVAALAAAGWHALAANAVTREQRAAGLLPVALVALAAVALLAVVVAAPGVPTSAVGSFADVFAITNRDVAVARLVDSLELLLPRLAGIAGATAFFIWLHGARPAFARLALVALFATLSFDLLVATSTLNPTASAAVYDPPAWAASTREHPSDRVYVGSRESTGMPGDSTVWSAGRYADERPDMAVRASESTVVATCPSAYRLRDTFSNDTAMQWPAEYRHFQTRFRSASRDERLRFLDRVGTRYFMLPYAPYADARLVSDVPGLELPRVYEREPAMPRAAVVLEAKVVPGPNAQTDLMFSAEHDPSRAVLLDAEPPAPTPAAEPAAAATAEIVEDVASRVVVRASVPAPDGYLVLADSYDSHWTVTVNDRPAPLLRANGLFRAVRLGAGVHTVRFEYRPRTFYAGAVLTPVVALALAWLALRERRTKPNER